MSTDAVLSLDISSSGVRARLHDRDMVTLAERAVDLATFADATGRSAHRFAEIQEAVRAVVRGVSGTGATIRAVAASGTASSFAWARRAGSEISDVSDVLLWSDSRALVAWPHVAEAARVAFERTLCPPDASYWPAKLLWARGEFGLGADAVFAGGKDFVFEWLTGRFWTDPMSGASTGVFDSARWEWDAPLLGAAGARPEQLPEVHDSYATAPLRTEVAETLGLPAGIPVATGGMDGPLTQIGACGFDAGIASCTIGTSIAYRANSAQRAVDPDARVWCYPIDRSHWVVGGAGNNGGNVLTWIRDRLGGEASVGELVAAAFDVAPDDGLFFVPYLSGERAPLWRPELRGGFIGLASHHGLPDLTRAAVEGIAAALIELAGTVRSAAGEQTAVRFTGGFIQQPRWVQIMTDALAADTGVPVPDSATSTGAAIIAWAAADGRPVDSVFTPNVAETWRPDSASAVRLAARASRLRQLRDLLWPVSAGETRGSESQ
ncbi:FGGY-family carbohydrate kinase [Gryllotalpicola reticulitermitis]|uniref:FGGY-family carbohydrate kinase n=1 Tax=Gryllotalpicola reticulitermitis TaxID=1184153 RepID=A0ABV8Q7M4_9MICO